MGGKASRLGKVLALAALALLAAAIAFGDLPGLFRPEAIAGWLRRAGALAPLLLMGLMAATVVTPLPTLPLDIAAGAVFGPALGTLYCAAGATAGAALSFLLARLLGREMIERFLRGHINFCTACSNRLLTGVIFLTRLLPVVSFDLVSYGAGLTRVSLLRFALATFLGMLPLTFVYTYFGAALAISKALAVGLGLGMVLLFFLLPRLIEKHDFLHLRRFFQHTGPPPGKGGE